MVGMAERIQAIEGQLNEIKALLHQVHHNSLAQDERLRRAAAAAHQASAIGGRAKMNAPAGSRSRLHLGAGPVRSAARDPAQHQGRRIYLLVRPVARLDAEGHPGRPRHHEPLSLPADRGRNLPRADPDRDGHHQPRLHSRPGARPEFHRVSAEARLRRLHAGLDRAEAGRKKPADGGLRPRLHPGLRPPRAAGFRRDTTSP